MKKKVIVETIVSYRDGPVGESLRIWSLFLCKTKPMNGRLK
ncbi:hypothetical protein NQ117_10590 [Paenibacillus sp. SC116]|nr:hypothetical protein [Paenibacillus sp. SC116]MCR8844132.1 hypothetical protein [Paenibacillus sp. SC116]